MRRSECVALPFCFPDIAQQGWVGHGYELQIFGACIRAKHGRLSGLHLSGVSIVKEYTRQHLKPALLQVPVEHVIEKVVTREVPVEVCAFFVRVYGFLDVHSRTQIEFCRVCILSRPSMALLVWGVYNHCCELKNSLPLSNSNAHRCMLITSSRRSSRYDRALRSKQLHA